MHHFPTTDLDRIEDIAASATLAGSLAACGLVDLNLDGLSRGIHIASIIKMLNSEALFTEASLTTLADLEQELRQLVEQEAYYAQPYGWQDAEGDLQPDHCLTETGKRIDVVRTHLTRAIERARYCHKLLAAERFVGKARGLTM